MRRTLLLVLALALAWGLAACDSGTEPPVATSIELDLPAEVDGGDQFSVQARVLDQRGQEMPDAPLGWSVQTPEHGVRTGEWLVALRPGTLVVRAASREITVERSVQVQPGPAPDVPDTLMLALGDTLELSGTWGALGQLDYDLRVTDEARWISGAPVLDAGGVARGFGALEVDASVHGSRTARTHVRVTADGPVVTSYEQIGDTLVVHGYRMGALQGLEAGGSALEPLAADSARAEWRVPDSFGPEICEGTARGLKVTVEGGTALESVWAAVPRGEALELDVGEIRMLGRGTPCLRFPEGEGEEVDAVAVLDAWDLDKAASEGFERRRVNDSETSDLVAQLENRSGLASGALARTQAPVAPAHVHEEGLDIAEGLIFDRRTWNRDDPLEAGQEFEARRWFADSGITTFRVVGRYAPNLVAIAPVEDLEAHVHGMEAALDSIDFAMRVLEDVGYDQIASMYGHPTPPVSNPATGDYIVPWELDEANDSAGSALIMLPMDGHPDAVRTAIYVRLEGRGGRGFTGRTGDLFHEMGHAFQKAYRGDWMLGQAPYTGDTGSSGRWASEGTPEVAAGEVSRQLAGLDVEGDYFVTGPPFSEDSWAHNTRSRHVLARESFQWGYGDSAPFIRYVAEQLYRGGLSWEVAVRTAVTGAEGGWLGRSRTWNDGEWLIYELPSYEDRIREVYPDADIETWLLRFYLSRAGDGWTDNPWLRDLFVHRAGDRQWYADNGMYTVIAREGMGYVFTDETPGWVYEGMYGSGLWTWIWDRGLGGSFQINSNRDPGTIAVGVARLR